MTDVVVRVVDGELTALELDEALHDLIEDLREVDVEGVRGTEAGAPEHARGTDLPCAAVDARELAEVLGSRGVGEFDVAVLAEQDARSVRRGIEDFFASAARDDLLLLPLPVRAARGSAEGRRSDPGMSVDRVSGSLHIGRNIQSLYLGSEIAPLLPLPLHRAVVDGAPWERFGATLGLERLLRDASPRTREAAGEALIPLIRDVDPEVAERAKSVWQRCVGSRVPISRAGAAHPAATGGWRRRIWARRSTCPSRCRGTR